ncbi:unnamed protein product, partial [marine sediment metagenome]
GSRETPGAQSIDRYNQFRILTPTPNRTNGSGFGMEQVISQF